MADKTQPQRFSKRQATEDDVEGHIHHARASEGFSKRQAAEGEGFSKRQATEGEGFSKRQATEGDDVEGHSLMDPFAARQLSQARERDVQQHLRRREFEQDTRAAKKDRR